MSLATQAARRSHHLRLFITYQDATDLQFHALLHVVLGLPAPLHLFHSRIVEGNRLQRVLQRLFPCTHFPDACWVLGRTDRQPDMDIWVVAVHLGRFAHPPFVPFLDEGRFYAQEWRPLSTLPVAGVLSESALAFMSTLLDSGMLREIGISSIPNLPPADDAVDTANLLCHSNNSLQGHDQRQRLDTTR